MGLSKLPITLGKMADFGERKDGGIEGKTFISKFSLMVSYQEMYISNKLKQY